MAYRVRIDNFEGPFDLLLYLVNKQKVDIGSISVSNIVDQYIAYIHRMQELDLDVASDFLLVAATLLDIKAASLIPQDSDEQDLQDIEEMSVGEARDILLQRLFAYMNYKNVTAALQERLRQEHHMHGRTVGPDKQFLGLMPNYLERVNLDDLALLCAQNMARKELVLLESEHIAARPIPLAPRIRSFHARISEEKHIKFSQLLEESPSLPLKVVSFLAVLELYKQTMINLTQNEAFSDIDIDYIEGSGELVVEDDFEEDFQ
ncbi:MAG: segregation/condensation protein A [Eggerthellaceae bacterium]|nr:segregation/condensation protein A [Eggerthellaceae bacterium]